MQTDPLGKTGKPVKPPHETERIRINGQRLTKGDCGCIRLTGNEARQFVQGLQDALINSSLPMQIAKIWISYNKKSNESEKLKDRPKGTKPADKGADKWGQRNGKGKKEGRRRFHDIKGKDNMSGSADNWSVDPSYR